MSEQIKADFARAQKFIKAGQHTEAITVLKPHAAHPRIAALLADLEARRKPVGSVLKTVLWIVLVVVVGIVAGAGGYAIGEQNTQAEYEIPIDLELLFVEVCAINTDLTGGDCSQAVRSSWLYYRSETIDCFSLYQDTPSTTDGEFLNCIADVRD